MNLRRLSEPGPLLAYIAQMKGVGLKKEARETVIMIRRILATEDGRELLKFIENATMNSPSPILADPRALAAKNAQSFIAHDLMRIVGGELDELVEGK